MNDLLIFLETVLRAVCGKSNSIWRDSHIVLDRTTSYVADVRSHSSDTHSVSRVTPVLSLENRLGDLVCNIEFDTRVQPKDRIVRGIVDGVQ
jgi:hypothetical protein